ncbi:pilus assembly protein [Faecalicatena contorta]|uniref:DUF859 family phage minor structural protein n=1 Tax=Faecalicatena contorta TaxID=39482 RepID=UPI00129E9F20|nr:DUF859 family phage minor structural protein [Faecalicatena contorta]MRM89616.1 pilus assembly protein [Faecalicatena contorta]
MAQYQTRMRLISEININKEKNTSYVTVAFDFRRTDYYYYGYNLTGEASWNIKVDSQSSGDINFTYNWNIPQNEWKEIGRYGFTIMHDADGTKEIKMSGSINFGAGVSPGSLSGEGSTKLMQILRATTPVLSNNRPDIGNTITINLPRASSTLSHNLTYEFGSASGTISSSAGASVSWTLPNTLAAQLPKTSSGTGKITCKTYSGSTLAGTKTISFTATVPSTMKPSIKSITISEAVTGLNAQFAAYVQNKSKFKVVTNAVGIYGSEITSYKTEVNGKSYAGSSVTTGYITASGSVEVKVTVTDSRGRSFSKSEQVNVAAYSNPKITSFTAARCTAAGDLDDEGSELSIGLNFSVSNVGDKNTKIYVVELLKNGTSSWAPVVSGSKYSYNSTYITSSSLSLDSSYTLRLRVTDYFTTTIATVDISSGFTLMDFRSTGKGMAVGKVSEKDAFEVGRDADFKGSVMIGGKKLLDMIYPVGSIYMSVKNTNPGTLFGGTWAAWGAGKVPVGINTADDNFNTVEKTGGASTHKLTTAQIPAHSHSIPALSGSAASAGAHTHTTDVYGSTGDFSNNATNLWIRGGASVAAAYGVSKATKSAGAHTHTVTTKAGTSGSAGTSGVHNNLQPYITCYMWKRTA